MFLLARNGTSPPYEGAQGGLAVAMSSVCTFLTGWGASDPGFGSCEGCFVPALALKPPLPPLLKGGTTCNGIRMNVNRVLGQLFISPRWGKE